LRFGDESEEDVKNAAIFTSTQDVEENFGNVKPPEQANFPA
jgi:hypothetical protein